MTPIRSEFPPHILRLHESYELLWGSKISLNWFNAQAWRTWQSYAEPQWTESDLKLVFRYVHKKYEPRFHHGMLRFSKLIGQPDTFEEYVGPARADGRPRPPATIVATYNGGTNKIVPNPGTSEATRSMADVIAEMRRAADMAS